MRRTKIIATLGPASSNAATITKLIDAGTDVFRINCSHADHPMVAGLIQSIRDTSLQANRPVGILLDLSGPKIRTQRLKNDQPVELEAGADFTLTNQSIEGSATRVGTSYSRLPQEVHYGQTILLDDGLIELEVVSKTDTDVLCKVISGGTLKNFKGINLPGAKLSIPSLTEKDLDDLQFGLKCGVDFVALSFVRTAKDIADLKKAIGNQTPAPMICAKLEKPEAIEHLDEILAAVDIVMVARGDLGVELPPEKVPPIQKLVIQMANRKGKAVITATQMLESMLEHPRPTRAEASDVANAIFDGTDAVMLSGETASGKYPIEAVKMMDRIAVAAEESMDFTKLHIHELPTSAHAIAHAACSMAIDMKASAIATFTRTGVTARLVSQLRPPGPIIALTQEPSVWRQLSLFWGMQPLMLTEASDSEATLAMVEKTLLEKKFVKPGENLVITGGLPIAARGPANFVKLSTLSN
jgi:pyruvate kinase